MSETLPVPTQFPAELRYVLLLFALFVVPRLLQRFRIAPALTSLALGAASAMGFGLFVGDPTVQLLSTFGIVSLFVFAGLELEPHELRRGGPVLAQHLLVRVVVLAGVAWIVHAVIGLAWRPSVLVALALLTPSTGFILDSLQGFGFGPREAYWVKSKAIATELLALVALFVTVQSDSGVRLAVAGGVLVATIALLPVLFHLFARWVLPHAPRTEFAFLLMIGVACALLTRQLGVYYLVGAFVTGLVASAFRERMPAIASPATLHAVELFAAFFVPFYFFHAGLELSAEDFSVPALLTGAAFVVILLPLRVGLITAHRAVAVPEPGRERLRIALALLPTLVFTLVIAQILRDRFDVPRHVFGGLVVYTVVNTLLPGLLLRVPPPAYDTPHVEVAVADGADPPRAPTA